MSGHLDTCRARVYAYAHELRDAARAGRLNESAIEGLVRSFLEQPAYWHEQREALLREAMEGPSNEIEKERTVNIRLSCALSSHGMILAALKRDGWKNTEWQHQGIAGAYMEFERPATEVNDDGSLK